MWASGPGGYPVRVLSILVSPDPGAPDQSRGACQNLPGHKLGAERAVNEMGPRKRPDSVPVDEPVTRLWPEPMRVTPTDHLKKRPLITAFVPVLRFVTLITTLPEMVQDRYSPPLKRAERLRAQHRPGRRVDDLHLLASTRLSKSTA